MKLDYYVYLHRRKSDGLVFYVGKGRNYRCKATNGRTKFWKNVANKHGWTHEILQGNLSEQEAFELEIDTIALMRLLLQPLVNLNDGGPGLGNWHANTELVKQMAQDRKSSERWKAGVEKMKRKLTGRTLSPEHRSAISAATLGQPKTEEFKLKLSEIKKNCPKAQAHIRSLVEKQRDPSIYTFYHKSGDTFQGTRKDFQTYSGVKLNKVSQLFQANPRKSVHGWSIDPDYWTALN